MCTWVQRAEGHEDPILHHLMKSNINSTLNIIQLIGIKNRVTNNTTHCYSLVCYSEGKLKQRLLCRNHFELAGQIVAECVGNSKEMLNLPAPSCLPGQSFLWNLFRCSSASLCNAPFSSTCHFNNLTGSQNCECCPLSVSLNRRPSNEC